jgi:hypothetical protein
MDLRRLRSGEWLAVAGGVALLVSLFTNWYSARVKVDGSSLELSQGFSAWESFTVIDVLLALIALAGIGLGAVQAAQTRPAMPLAAAVVTLVIGFVGVLLVAFRMLEQPGENQFIDLDAGAWLGLAATAAITAGAWLSMADERVRHIPPGPEPELRHPPS